jgi:hypothetical protein
LPADARVLVLYHQLDAFSGGVTLGDGVPFPTALDRLEAQLTIFRDRAIDDLTQRSQTASGAYLTSLQTAIQQYQGQLNEIAQRQYTLNGADASLSAAEALSLAGDPRVYLVDPIDASNLTSEPLRANP